MVPQATGAAYTAQDAAATGATELLLQRRRLTAAPEGVHPLSATDMLRGTPVRHGLCPASLTPHRSPSGTRRPQLLNPFPPGLHRLAHLQSLDLSDNPSLCALSAACLPPHLTCLRLTGCGLTSLPDGLPALRCLRQLFLSANLITGGLKPLLACSSLEHAGLAFNRISHLWPAQQELQRSASHARCPASASTAAGSGSAGQAARAPAGRGRLARPVPCATGTAGGSGQGSTAPRAPPARSSPLVSFDLSHNDLSDLPATLSALSQLPALQSLALAGTPAALAPGYHAACLACLPRLTYLDGSAASEAAGPEQAGGSVPASAAPAGSRPGTRPGSSRARPKSAAAGGGTGAGAGGSGGATAAGVGGLGGGLHLEIEVSGLVVSPAVVAAAFQRLKQEREQEQWRQVLQREQQRRRRQQEAEAASDAASEQQQAGPTAVGAGTGSVVQGSPAGSSHPSPRGPAGKIRGAGAGAARPPSGAAAAAAAAAGRPSLSGGAGGGTASAGGGDLQVALSPSAVVLPPLYFYVTIDTPDGGLTHGGIHGPLQARAGCWLHCPCPLKCNRPQGNLLPCHASAHVVTAPQGTPARMRGKQPDDSPRRPGAALPPSSTVHRCMQAPTRLRPFRPQRCPGRTHQRRPQVQPRPPWQPVGWTQSGVGWLCLPAGPAASARQACRRPSGRPPPQPLAPVARPKPARQVRRRARGGARMRPVPAPEARAWRQAARLCRSRCLWAAAAQRCGCRRRSRVGTGCVKVGGWLNGTLQRDQGQTCVKAPAGRAPNTGQARSGTRCCETGPPFPPTPMQASS
jgi:hypothetical protein